MAVDLGLELRDRLETAGIQREDELAGVRDLVRLGVEVDAVAAEQRAVQRAGKKTKD